MKPLGGGRTTRVVDEPFHRLRREKLKDEVVPFKKEIGNLRAPVVGCGRGARMSLIDCASRRY